MAQTLTKAFGAPFVRVCAMRCYGVFFLPFFALAAAAEALNECLWGPGDCLLLGVWTSAGHTVTVLLHMSEHWA